MAISAGGGTELGGPDSDAGSETGPSHSQGHRSELRRRAFATAKPSAADGLERLRALVPGLPQPELTPALQFDSFHPDEAMAARGWYWLAAASGGNPGLWMPGRSAPTRVFRPSAWPPAWQWRTGRRCTGNHRTAVGREDEDAWQGAARYCVKADVEPVITSVDRQRSV